MHTYQSKEFYHQQRESGNKDCTYLPVGELVKAACSGRTKAAKVEFFLRLRFRVFAFAVLRIRVLQGLHMVRSQQ